MRPSVDSAGGTTIGAPAARHLECLQALPALAPQLSGQAVLLVDDFVDTGWTCTVVARLLRRAGASEIYPFVLALTGQREPGGSDGRRTGDAR